MSLQRPEARGWVQKAKNTIIKVKQVSTWAMSELKTSFEVTCCSFALYVKSVFGHFNRLATQRHKCLGNTSLQWDNPVFAAGAETLISAALWGFLQTLACLIMGSMCRENPGSKRIYPLYYTILERDGWSCNGSLYTVAIEMHCIYKARQARISIISNYNCMLSVAEFSETSVKTMFSWFFLVLSCFIF